MSMSDQMKSPDSEWWRGAVIYQIYPRSFADTNGDGIGDLPGITAHLDHVARLGADAVWISPFFVSPMDDFGYDVADYRDVDPIFGTLADFDALLARAHALGLKVIIDLVLSHSSDRHPWFVESRSSRDNEKADWYVWADPKPDGTAPNNWLSIFGGVAWEWDTRRRQYYLHNFLASQPDLNFHNAQVQEALLDIARFWLDRGVDGFRLDTVNFYFHDADLRDNPPQPADTDVAGITRVNPFAFQDHLYSRTRPENLAFLERLRALADNYEGAMLMGEIGPDRDVDGTTAAYTLGGKRLHMAYSFELLGSTFSAAHLRRVLERVEDTIGSGWPALAFANHDVVRPLTRWGYADQADAAAPLLAALVTCLRGTACLFQGEELGLPEAVIAFEDLQDPYGRRFWPEYRGRDGCRTPMPWRAGAGEAGFTTGRPWLPVPPEHRTRSVDVQESVHGSTLERIRTFLFWRRSMAPLLRGATRFHDAPEPLVAFERALDGERILCLFNLGPTEVHLPLAVRATALEGHGFGGRVADDRVTVPGIDAAFVRLDA
jgi:alpha-glucosidase